MEGRNQIAYRLYDHNELVRENQITKETYQLILPEDIPER
jgi:hypothetical protein